MQRTLVAPVHPPAVAHKHAGVVDPEHGGRILEPAAGADGVDGGLRGDERPQPVGLDADAPGRFVGRDHRRVANLPAEYPVDRRGVAGGSMQQMNEAAGGDLQAELHRGRPKGVGCLETMAPLHAPAALRAATDLDVEAAYDGEDRGKFFLMLRGDAGLFDGATAVGTRPWHWRAVDLVDVRRAASGPLPAVPRPGPSVGPLAGPLRPVLGKGCSLAFAGAAGLIVLFLEVFAASLPAVSIAGGAVQIVDQLGVLPLKPLDALVPRILLSPGRPRTVASAALAGHARCIGTCAPTLHTTSSILSTLPANQRCPPVILSLSAARRFSAGSLPPVAMSSCATAAGAPPEGP